MIAPLALELAVLVPRNLFVTAVLVVPQFLYTLCLERATLEITRKLHLLGLDWHSFAAIIIVVVPQIGCQGISTRPV